MQNSLATVNPEPPTVAQMLSAIIEKGVTSESVGALEKMCDLYERMEDRNAEKAFIAAFVDLQNEMEAIEASRVVPNKDGTPRYKYAPFEEIMRAVRPHLKKHGFTVSFDSEVDAPRMVTICKLMHVAGHTKSSRYSCRIGSGPQGTSETQADGAALTYGKRGALCQILNIVVDHDDDARMQSADKITAYQVQQLRDGIKATNTDLTRFLKVAGAESIEAITCDKYETLMGRLEGLMKKAKL